MTIPNDDYEIQWLDGSDGKCVALAIVQGDEPSMVRCQEALHHLGKHKSKDIEWDQEPTLLS